ncbi:MAG: hypothetical protein LBU15_03080 [Rickettsiales bacterium]|nr:hypothetical protein [Rickettsiales bacterium]
MLSLLFYFFEDPVLPFKNNDHTIGNNSRKNDQKNILRKNFTLDMVSSRNQSETARGEMPGHSKFTLVYGRSADGSSGQCHVAIGNLSKNN